MKQERCGSPDYDQGVGRVLHWAVEKKARTWDLGLGLGTCTWLGWEEGGKAAVRSTFYNLLLLDLCSLLFFFLSFFFIFFLFFSSFAFFLLQCLFNFQALQIDSDLQKLLLLRKNVKSPVTLITRKILEVPDCFVVWKYVPLRREKVVFSRKEIVS